MAEIKYQPVSHNHDAFLKKARKRWGFQAAYQALAVQLPTIKTETAKWAKVVKEAGIKAE